MPRILIDFPHGLGDAVQLSIVLAHLRKYRPDWRVEVRCGRGKETAIAHLCAAVHVGESREAAAGPFDAVYSLGWWEGERLYNPVDGEAVSASKAVRCVADDFGLPVDPGCCRYSIEPTARAIGQARDWLARHCGFPPCPDGRFPALLLHYEGNTTCERKNLTHETARLVCDWATRAGLVPVILDWDRRSPLIDDRTVFCPRPGPGDIWGEFGSGDAGVLAALIAASAVFVGVDSGPLHVAAATNTPALGVWTGHNPLQFFDPADNVLHLLPKNWPDVPGLHQQPAGATAMVNTFRTTVGAYAYPSPAHRFQQGAGRDILQALEFLLGRGPAAVTDPPPAPGLVRVGDWWLHADNVEQDLVIVGDVYEQDAYRLRLLPGILAEAKLVLDIGAHVGCFARYVHERNPQATIVCVEACAENLDALRANVGEFAHVVHAACTYESGDVGLLNAIRPQCESTGGSTVRPLATLEGGPQQTGYVYWHDRRPLRKVTLEELVAEFGDGSPRVDLLKLDCEESEFSILAETQLLPHVRMIVGEYHGEARWHKFRAQRFGPAWDYGLMFSDGGGYTGLFHYANRDWRPPAETLDQWLEFKSQAKLLHDQARAVGERIARERIARNESALVAKLNAQSALKSGALNLKPATAIVASDSWLLNHQPPPPALVNPQPPPPGPRPLFEYDRPKVRGDNILRVAVPAGIGDSLWPLLKMRDLLRRTNAGQVQIAFCGGPPHRSQEFLERFDFVYRAYPCDLSTIEESDPILPSGGYNWTPSGQGWHGRFDYVLVANAHLERGERIETWLPELAIDWELPSCWRYTAAEIGFAAELRRRLGEYVAIYCGPLEGNTTAGHNRGPRWRPGEWASLIEFLTTNGRRVVVLGAEWDRSYFDQQLAPLIERLRRRDCVENLIGQTSIGQTFAAIQGARAFVGYQSGLVVWSALLGVPTVGFWRAAGDSILPDRHLSFSEAMAHCWTPPGAVESGRYLPAIYGRTCAADIVDWSLKYGWL